MPPEEDPLDFGEEEEAPPEPPAQKPPPVVDAGARPDSAAAIGVGAEAAEPETLRYVPVGQKPPPPDPRAERDEPTAQIQERKPKQGIFGLPPAVLFLGLTAAHIFVVRMVTD